MRRPKLLLQEEWQVMFGVIVFEGCEMRNRVGERGPIFAWLAGKTRIAPRALRWFGRTLSEVRYKVNDLLFATTAFKQKKCPPTTENGR